MGKYEDELLDGIIGEKDVYESLDIAPWYWKVKLVPPDEKDYELPCRIYVPATKHNPILDGIDGKVKLEGTTYNIYNIDNIIDCKVYLNTDKIDIGNKDKPETLDVDYWKNYSIDGLVYLPNRLLQTDFSSTLVVPGEIHRPDRNDPTKLDSSTIIDGKVELEPNIYNHVGTGLYGKAHVKYWKSNTDISFFLQVDPIKVSSDLIDGKTHIDKEDCSSDIDSAITVQRFYHATDLNSVIKVEGYRLFYTIPLSVTVVPGVCYDIYSKFRVVNKGFKNLDAKVRLLKDKYESDDIDCKASLVPAAYKFINGRVNLFKVITRRDLDVKVHHIGGTIADIDSTVVVTPPPITPIEYTTDINCVVSYGYTKKSELNGILNVNPAKNLDIYIPMELYIRERARIGIVTDPRWHYDPFVLKSTLLTLFDKYYQKIELNIVYGGNPRSDWDIEHLGYVYKYNLEKVPIFIDPRRPGLIRDSLYHYMNHLFLYAVNKVFLFMDKPTMIKGSYMAPLAHYCYKNSIPIVIIDSAGEWFQFSENVKRDYDYKTENINNTIHNQHHEHIWIRNRDQSSKPNDGNFDNPPPRIVY